MRHCRARCSSREALRATGVFDEIEHFMRRRFGKGPGSVDLEWLVEELRFAAAPFRVSTSRLFRSMATATCRTS